MLVLVLAIQCFAAGVPAKSDGGKMGKLEGTVSTGDTSAGSYVAGANVQASGPVTIETETNAEGQFAFGEVPAGSYTLTVSALGLEAQQIVILQDNQILQISLHLKPTVVVVSVNVSAQESATQSPTPTQTITEKTLRDAPNYNERMENLLPLVPGLFAGLTGGSI